MHCIRKGTKDTTGTRRGVQIARHLAAAVAGALLVAASAGALPVDDGVADNTGVLPLPSGQKITPTAAPGSTYQPLNPGLSAFPNFIANGAVKTALSPNGHTLLVMTSGYNLLSNAAGATSQTSQYVFVYDVSGANRLSPVLLQVLQVADTYVGLVWSPDGTKFYVSGGSTDSVVVYAASAASYVPSTTISLGHTAPGGPFAAFLSTGIGFAEAATAAGLGLSADGKTLVVANIYNDSISIINTVTNTVTTEYDLRPYNTDGASGTGKAGGEAPFTVAVAGSGASTVAYVSSIRDREVVAVNIGGATPTLVKRISLPGNPNSMVLNAAQTQLYVSQDNSDSVAVISTATNSVVEEISTIAPAGVVPSGTKYTGAAANSVALSPDEHTLYVTNGGANSVAVIPLAGAAPHSVSGLIPTAWYPHSVSVAADGSALYVSNGKSDPGANPNYNVTGANQYVLQLEGGGLLTVPVPGGSALATLTSQVAANNGYSAPVNPADAATMGFLRGRIQHVIYIIKENRTFDQILGDLTNGSNASPKQLMYGKRVTPNLHAAASNFVTLDNFFCSGEVSGNGWAWSTEARESDHGVKSIPPNYAGRGASNDSEGLNRIVNVGIASVSGRAVALGPPLPALGNNYLYPALASYIKGGYANLLPGTNNDFATDGPAGSAAQTGYLWDAALRAGLTVRNYGFFVDIVPYNIPTSIGGISVASNPTRYQYPFANSITVAHSSNPSLQTATDPYFWGFDNAYPDVWREQEWAREFAGYVTAGNLPTLTLLRLMHDHTGNFSTAVGGLNTAELQVADNDYAVGRVLQTVANSPYAGNTLVFVIEDDAQDGPDHMDAHRSTAYVVGPYVKQGAVVSQRYSTVNMVRTIEDILGLDHLNLNDAYQRPMTEIFDTSKSTWTFKATASPYLASTGILGTLPAAQAIKLSDSLPAKPARSAAWWAKATRGLDFSDADKVAGELGEVDAYSRIEWRGVHPGVPYPAKRSGKQLGIAAKGEGPVESTR